MIIYTIGRASVINWVPPAAQPVVPPSTVNTPRASRLTPSPTLAHVHPGTPAITAQPIPSHTATVARGNADSPPPSQERYTENSRKNMRRKRARMQSVNSPGFIEIESSFQRTIVWYFRKNVEKAISYRLFLQTIEPELIGKLRECVSIHPIKYNLKLEASYVVPNVDESRENRAFKTSAKELYAHSDVAALIDRDFIN